MSARDALVVGGGLAGAAFATALAKAGRDVVLIERETLPHDKVCGEFLSREAVGYLAALDVDLAGLGAVPIRRVRLSRGTISVASALPFTAASLSRRALDEALLRRAAEAGVDVVRGRAVRRLERTGDGWTADLNDGGTVSASHAALACGKHDLRGLPRPAGLHNDLIGLKMHFRPTSSAAAALRETVLLGLFTGGYAGLEPIEGGLANLCLVVRGERFAACGRDWRALLGQVRAAAPALDEALGDAAPVHDRPLAVARIPYGLVVRTSEDGCWRLGDQAAVVPSFAGEGMSMALHSARLAAETIIAGGSAADYQARFAADVGLRVRLGARLSKSLMGAQAQGLAALLCKAFPQSLSHLAEATRIPDAALA